MTLAFVLSPRVFIELPAGKDDFASPKKAAIRNATEGSPSRTPAGDVRGAGSEQALINLPALTWPVHRAGRGSPSPRGKSQIRRQPVAR